MLRSSEMTTKTRYRLGTGANKQHPLCRLGNDRAPLWSDQKAGLITWEQNTSWVTAPHGDTGPPYQLGAAAFTLTCRADAHRC